MTKEQAERIRELRMQGKGYKAAASAVGLSRDIVRNYCKANGMEGYGEAAKLNLQRDGGE
jgi:DNA invertase Pin-like site-specific DNA recombinase